MNAAAKLAAILWIAISFAGLAALAKYKSVPGPRGVRTDDWPVTSAMRRDIEKPTLVLFLHPRCPCSRATVGELGGVLSRAAGRAAVRVATYQPEDGAEDWGDTDLSRTVAALPGVILHRDVGGREARNFGAATSGHVLLYDPNGRLRFSGGITAARDHLGDNPGQRALIDLLLTGKSDIASTPVYGCTILEDPLE